MLCHISLVAFPLAEQSILIWDFAVNSAKSRTRGVKLRCACGPRKRWTRLLLRRLATSHFLLCPRARQSTARTRHYGPREKSLANPQHAHSSAEVPIKVRVKARVDHSSRPRTWLLHHYLHHSCIHKRVFIRRHHLKVSLLARLCEHKVCLISL